MPDNAFEIRKDFENIKNLDAKMAFSSGDYSGFLLPIQDELDKKKSLSFCQETQ